MALREKEAILSRQPTCAGDGVSRCVANYAKPRLSPADLRAIQQDAIPMCFATHDPDVLARQGACLPLDVGVDARNGRVVQLRYNCSDVCPDYGGVGMYYAGVSQEKCCSIGGYPHIGVAWGTYQGCFPPEVPLPRFNYPRPDGLLALATRSPCDPTHVVFDDGTVVIDAKYHRRR